MPKPYRYIAAIVVALAGVFGFAAITAGQSIPTISPWYYFGGGISAIRTLSSSTQVVVGATATSTTAKLQTPSFAITGLPNENCLGTDATGLLQSGTCTGGGGGDSFWTKSGTNLYTSSTIAKVGILTTAPSTTLHVVGSFRVSASSTFDTLTASRAVISDASQSLYSSAVTATELGYVSGVTSAIQTQLDGKQATITTGNLTASSPLSLSATRQVIGGAAAVSIQNAAADGATLGAAAFTASDFDAASGVISIDYTNGQAASGANKGFLTAADWTTFNNKQNALTLPLTIANGGTGTSTQPTDLQVLTGATPTWKTITAGTNIAVTTSTTAVTFAFTGTLPVANGGTNLTSAADDNLMLGNGTTWQSKALTTCTDTGGNHLNYDASTNTFSCGTSSSGGGGGGSVSTSTPITQFTFPFWQTTTGGLNGSSSIYYSASNANIGIATAVPSSTLHVVGTFQVSATTTLSQLGTGIVHSNSTGVLTSSAVALGGSDVSGTLGVTNGGTGLATVSQGDILYGSASNVLSALAKNTSATRYLSNTGSSNNPAWAQIDLTNGVTGALPIANGGTATTTTPGVLKLLVGNGTNYDLLTATAGTGITLSTSTTALTIAATLGTSVDLTSEVTGTLPVGNGGTNATSWTAGSVVFASSTTLLGQDNSNLYYDNTNHRLGLGTTAPASTLQVIGTLQVPTSTSALTLGGQLKVSTATSSLIFHDGTAERALNPVYCPLVYNVGTVGSQYFTALMNAGPVPATSTITAVYAGAHQNVAGNTATFNIYLTNDRSVATSTMRKLFTSNQTVTSTSTRSTLTVNGSTTINSSDMVLIDFAPASTTDFGVSACLRVNP